MQPNSLSQPTTRARSWWPIVQSLLSLALLGWLLSRVDLVQLGALLLTIDLRFWVGGLVVAMAAWLLNTLKWQQLLGTQGYHTSYPVLLALNYIGMYYSILLPGQVSGEVVKGVRLARLGTPASLTALSIAMDRLTGLTALGLLGLIGLLLAPPPFAYGPLLGLATLVVVAATAPLALLLLRAPKTASAEAPEALNELQRLAHQATQALTAYRRRPNTLLLALAQGIAFQTLIAVSNYLIAWGVGAQISPLALLWIVSIVSLVSMLPIFLGGLGVREGAYAFLLQQYGVPFSYGLSLSLAVFGIILTLGLLGGMVETFWPGLTHPHTTPTARPLSNGAPPP